MITIFSCLKCEHTYCSRNSWSYASVYTLYNIDHVLNPINKYQLISMWHNFTLLNCYPNTQINTTKTCAWEQITLFAEIYYLLTFYNPIGKMKIILVKYVYQTNNKFQNVWFVNKYTDNSFTYKNTHYL